MYKNNKTELSSLEGGKEKWEEGRDIVRTLKSLKQKAIFSFVFLLIKAMK